MAQINAPATVSKKAFNLANAMVSNGEVKLGTLSVYLREANKYFPNLITKDEVDLLADHSATLLVAPKDTATLFDRDLGTFNEDTASIRKINESHGLHHNGQILKGMDIADRATDAPADNYEKNWSREVVKDFMRAVNDNVTVTADLAIGTKQIVHGCEIGTCDVTVRNNLYSNVSDLNAAFKAQGGQEIITQRVSSYARWQFTATEDRYGRSDMYSVGFADGNFFWVHKAYGLSSSRPVALRILAP